MKKIAVYSLVGLLTLSCSVSSPNNSPTVHENYTKLAQKYNFAELEKEYKSLEGTPVSIDNTYKGFSTKALSDSYIQRMFTKFLVTTPNPTQVIRQLEFARYLKDVKSDSSYFNSLNTIISNDPTMYTKINAMTEVGAYKTAHPATFGAFIDNLNPVQAPAVPGLPNPSTTLKTSSGFTANWEAVSGTGITYDFELYQGDTLVAAKSGNTSSLTYPVTGLTASTAYTWKVRSKKDSLYSSYTAVQSVTTDVPPVADYSGQNLAGYNFTNANLIGANFTNANLTGANLSGANLTNAIMTGATLTGAQISNAYFSNVDMRTIKGTSGIANDFSSFYFGMARLDGANLTGANLTGAAMFGANLTNANLSYANLSNLTIMGAPATGVNLSYANLAGATMDHVTLTGANLTGASLTGTTLTGSNFNAATWTDGHVCAAGDQYDGICH